MTKKINLFLLGLGLAFGSQISVAADKPFQWPTGAKAAINLAYDDALPTQLDNAIPALDKYGLKGSFYLTLSAETVANRMADWRKAAINGHELANHTIQRTWHQLCRHVGCRSEHRIRSRTKVANLHGC